MLNMQATCRFGGLQHCDGTQRLRADGAQRRRVAVDGAAALRNGRGRARS